MEREPRRRTDRVGREVERGEAGAEHQGDRGHRAREARRDPGELEQLERRAEPEGRHRHCRSSGPRREEADEQEDQQRVAGPAGQVADDAGDPEPGEEADGDDERTRRGDADAAARAARPCAGGVAPGRDRRQGSPVAPPSGNTPRCSCLPYTASSASEISSSSGPTGNCATSVAKRSQSSSATPRP